MSKSLIIRGGTVIDPSQGINAPHDVLVRNGIIAALLPAGAETPEAGKVIDASGCWVVPGLIDVHVHLREPGYEYKETVETGARSAVAGGFTAVACMANTNPINDSAAVTEYILERSAVANLAHVYPIGAVSKGLKGEELAEIGEMKRAGICAVSDDGMPIMSGVLMRRALEYSSMFGLPVIVHEEDRDIAAGGVMNEGEWSVRLGLRGMPAAAEDAMVARDIALLEHSGGKLHVAHLSTVGAVDMVRAAKRRGLAITAEATPHHFTLTEAAVEGYNTNAKMNPPLRTQKDVDAVRAGILDGTIDIIATDHAPHHRDEKEVEFDLAANGIIGLETALPLALAMAREIGLSNEALVRAMSSNPAKLLGVAGGTLAEGSPADITVIDPEARWKLQPENLQSKSRNTPFVGASMAGRARVTMVGGRVVWEMPRNGGKK